jgi:hypothetical protein
MEQGHVVHPLAWQARHPRGGAARPPLFPRPFRIAGIFGSGAHARLISINGPATNLRETKK